MRKGPGRKSPINGIADALAVDSETVDDDISSKSRSTRIPVGLDDDNWVVSGSEKEYIPMAEDVGCVLKVCKSILLQDRQ